MCRSAVSGVKHKVDVVLTALPARSHRVVPGSLCSFCTLHVLYPWTLDTPNLGLPCACLECPAEGLCTLSGSSTATGSSFPGAEVKMRT